MSGIKILKRLLMKEAMKRDAPFQNEGIMSISKALTTNVDSKVNRIVEGAKKQGIDFDQYNEEQVKYILELNRPKLQPRAIPADTPEGRGITKALLGRKEGKVIKTDFGKPFAKEVESTQDIADARLIKDMYRTAGPRNLDEDAEYLAEFIAEDAGKVLDDLPASEQKVFIDRAKNALKKNVEKYKTGEVDLRQKMVDDAIDNSSPGFTGDTKYDAQLVADDLAEKMYGKDFYDLSQKQQMDLYDKAYTGLSKQRFKGMRKPKDDDPEDMATGGRAGFSMGRRAFLKLLGGAAAGIGALKAGALKMFGKEGAKKVATDVVTTAPVPGKPAWFDSLVNKVIREGDDVTKKFATKEREIVHTKKIDEDNTVTVTQDLDEGIVRVEYDSPTNTFEDTVQLQYKKPLPDEANPNPQAEFTTAESGPVGRQSGPDDYDIEIDEVGGTSIKDLDSDVSKLKEYATGQKPTLKEIVQNKKRKDKAQRITDDPEEQSDAVVRRQGEMLDYDGPDDDFASGGRVGLLSGGGVIRVMLKKLAERYGKKPSELLAVTNYKSLPVEVRKFLTKEQFELIKKDMQSRRVEQFENLRDMIKSRQEFDRSAEALKKMGMDISDTMLPIMNKGVTPGGTTADDLLMMEQVIKNLRMKDRKLNASGGLAGMLGE